MVRSLKGLVQGWAPCTAPILSKLRAGFACVMALALALSMGSVAAFAEEGDSGEEGGAAQGIANVPTINVTVPTSFILGGDAGIDIQDLSEVSDTAEFINNSNVPVRIKQVACDATGLNTYFDVGDANTAALSLAGNHLDWIPKDEGSVGIYAQQDDDGQGFILIPDESEEATLTLQMAGLGLTDKVKEATKDRNALRDLMKMSWTFEMVYLEGGSATPDLNSDFYLKDKFSQITYSLEDVKAHSRIIEESSNDAVEYIYKLWANDDSLYECQVRYNGAYWPLRIIGVRQDQKANSDGGPTPVGLTFQFKDCVSSRNNKGGSDVWNGSPVRAGLQEGGAYFKLMPSSVRESIVPVNKWYKPQPDQGAKMTVDQMFIAGHAEMGAFSWTSFDGTGPDHNEAYIYYQTPGRNLIKKIGPGASEGATSGVFWWVRSASRRTAYNFCVVNNNGAGYSEAGSGGNYGVCPCFCL